MSQNYRYNQVLQSPLPEKVDSKSLLCPRTINYNPHLLDRLRNPMNPPSNPLFPIGPIAGNLRELGQVPLRPSPHNHLPRSRGSTFQAPDTHHLIQNRSTEVILLDIEILFLLQARTAIRSSTYTRHLVLNLRLSWNARPHYHLQYLL